MHSLQGHDLSVLRILCILACDEWIKNHVKLFSVSMSMSTDVLLAYVVSCRHNYGKVGNGVNYSPYSCLKIINHIPTAGDHCGMAPLFTSLGAFYTLPSASRTYTHTPLTKFQRSFGHVCVRGRVRESDGGCMTAFGLDCEAAYFKRPITPTAMIRWNDNNKSVFDPSLWQSSALIFRYSFHCSLQRREVSLAA